MSGLSKTHANPGLYKILKADPLLLIRMGDKTLRRPGTAELILVGGKLRFMARLFIKVQNRCRVNTVLEMLDCKHFDHLLGLTMGGFLKQLNIIKR
ncbi:hypothetical protein EB796_014396 [Bugula neritina]|uniref:Uncharacterized protein n=1 Tax=Bugula neritina TaxID=10212 RepID=A0A7J7JLQ1_BUGNE|nr:hypothetical protein EB796_014396 [Bugula neritina]